MKLSFADLVTVTSGTLLCPDGMDGLYRVLNGLTGDSLFTHQLPAAAETMAPVLLEQHPWLSSVVVPEGMSVDEVHAWVEWGSLEYGVEFEVTPAPERWGSHDPLQELVDRVGAERVIPVVISDSEATP